MLIFGRKTKVIAIADEYGAKLVTEVADKIPHIFNLKMASAAQKNFDLSWKSTFATQSTQGRMPKNLSHLAIRTSLSVHPDKLLLSLFEHLFFPRVADQADLPDAAAIGHRGRMERQRPSTGTQLLADAENRYHLHPIVYQGNAV
jgi:hypothetical protein